MQWRLKEHIPSVLSNFDNPNSLIDYSSIHHCNSYTHFLLYFIFWIPAMSLGQSHACICRISQSQHWVIIFSKIFSAVTSIARQRRTESCFQSCSILLFSGDASKLNVGVPKRETPFLWHSLVFFKGRSQNLGVQVHTLASAYLIPCPFYMNSFHGTMQFW